MTLDELTVLISHRASRASRFMVAIAGPPAAGKSTLADALLDRLNAAVQGSVGLVSMDGYHYDNGVIGPLGLLPRKGSPETFNAAGFFADLQRIRSGNENVAIPVFDRAADLARANACIITAAARIVLVEGNYLLLDRPPWDQLPPLFDLSVFIEVDEDELERRHLHRWRDHGWDAEKARRHVEVNDMPNSRLVLEHSRAADITIGVVDLGR